MFSTRRILQQGAACWTRDVACVGRCAAVPLHRRSIGGSYTHQCATAMGACGLSPAPLRCARRHVGTDAHSGASVVIVDPERAAEERDRAARQLLTGNFPARQEQRRSVMTLQDIAHTVPYSLCIATDGSSSDDASLVAARSILEECFAMVDAHLNCYNAESEISRVNKLPVGVKHTMSEHLKKVMACVQQVYRVSGSCFDPATAPLARRLREAARDPNATEEDFHISAEEAKRFTLSNSFSIHIDEGTIARKHSDAELDLGGVNKGYTVDCVVERLNEAGYKDVMFEWGGDVRASGVNVQRQAWAIGIVRPPTVDGVVEAARRGDGSRFFSCSVSGLADKSSGSGAAPEASAAAAAAAGDEAGAGEEGASPAGEATTTPSAAATEARPLLKVLPLASEALCTSGDYENVIFSPVLGKCVSSIYDWQTRQLIPVAAEGLSQVSVRCYNCMYADALATAALVKRDPVRVRYLMENYRRDYNRVTDYAAYTRQGERLAHMYEIARESPERRAERIAGSLPARVVVIGGGLAGQSAAIEAADCGAQVILLEKESRMGGNSAKATSGINAWGTRAQAMARVSDNCSLFERDTFLSGVGGHCDPGLIRTLSVKSADAIDFLGRFGIPLTVLSQLGGHSRKRTHRAPDTSDGTPVPIGYTIMQHLEQHIRTRLQGRVTVLTETAATDLITEHKTLPDGSVEVRVKGVKYRSAVDADADEMELPADAVVITTGGFSNDQTATSLLREYAPGLYGTPTTNGTFATGDGVKMAKKLGVTLVDMDKVQLHPTGLIDPKDPANKTKYLGPEALRGSGGILLNKNGDRFINELDLRSVVSQAIIAQNNEYPGSDGSKFAYCVLNEAAASLFGKNSLGFYWKTQGLFTKVENVAELAKLIDCSEENLRGTLENYEAVSKDKSVCPLTGKGVFPCVVGPEGPFYVAYVTPSIHYTMGGCLISPAAEMLTENNAVNIFSDQHPILGLYGAGEVTGGVHGRNRLGGNSLLECVVFGKIAGDRAATILQKDRFALSSTRWSPVVVRESRAGDQFGVGSRVLRFNLPGGLQTSGLSVGEFIGIRGEWDGQQLIGYYSPITLPGDRGRISILARGDKGSLQEWIGQMRPGDSVEMKACGGLRLDHDPVRKQLSYKKHVIRKFALIAGGSGVAPMLQLIRAALNRPYVDNFDSVNLVYAAEGVSELTYRHLLGHYTQENPDKLKVHFVLTEPPEGWTGGVGYIEADTLKTHLQPPQKDLLVVICGPPVMQRSVKEDLIALGYSSKLVHTIDEDMTL